MQDIIYYVKKYKNKTFLEKPFNNVDALVLAQLSYIDFESVPHISEQKRKVSIQQIVKALDLNVLAKSILNGGKNRRLLLAIASSKRYSHLHLNYYINHIDEISEKQFSAVTFYLQECTYIVFRGTDSTIVGWKEDFNMLFQSPIPSQTAGVRYLEHILPLLDGNIIVGGHSKGGNIAMYSTMHINTTLQDKIKLIYSFDGPGFRSEIRQSSAYQNIKERVIKIMPQSSMVGILFEEESDYTIIRSKNIWITQHDPFSWEVKNGDFIYLEKPNKSLMRMNYKLNRWLDTLDTKDKEKFVEGVYDIYRGCDAKTLEEFTSSWKQNASIIFKSIKTLDKETRSYIFKTIKSMLKFLVWKEKKEA
ncbi:hypothetical protein M2475_001947 [Breznakia sp. PF5-3]|uniref:Mbeg1-like protein n=1 Tax=unclassified Breznakia TaxID=2623764 RepID=UPI002404F9C7|nr:MULTISPECIES: Mbeg1-like protein [unclassified Breznakia]MDF9825511.1 hypothetical protein [Breznakia sp. PM6-1]MDF9836367.1 hypothetical protein [Breznakia sp. PF5-3]MDF9837483.1 hypothetical protein [Breznakia sp. PFB2-8]MDF9859454.1 hypothetical protein [Breznakia sp. PH5-24]